MYSVNKNQNISNVMIVHHNHNKCANALDQSKTKRLYTDTVVFVCFVCLAVTFL